jgi:hypothetical protein
MPVYKDMPGKIRTFDRRFIRLSDTNLASVEHLARLAGVTPSDVVDFVLTEVLEGACLADHELTERPGLPITPHVPHRAKAPARPCRRPADVIPIDRRHGCLKESDPPEVHTQVRTAVPIVVPILEYRDLTYLRRAALEVRGLARTTRAHAVEACHRATCARDRAATVLEQARAAL